MFLVAPPALERAGAHGTTLSWHAQVPGHTTSKGQSKEQSRRWGGKQLPPVLKLHEAIQESANMEVLMLRELG